MAFTQLPTGGGVPNVDLITQTLAKLQPDSALQNYARMHKNDPYILSLATAESNRRKALRLAAQGQNAGPQPTVADQNIAGMAPAPVMTGAGVPLQTGYGGPVTTGMASGGLPEDQGIAQLPTPNMQRMADGGIAGYEDDQEGMATGGMGGMFNFAQQSEPVVRMSGGGHIPRYKEDGLVRLPNESFAEFRRRVFEAELQAERDRNAKEKELKEAERLQLLANRKENKMVPPSPFFDRTPLAVAGETSAPVAPAFPASQKTPAAASVEPQPVWGMGMPMNVGMPAGTDVSKLKQPAYIPPVDKAPPPPSGAKPASQTSMGGAQGIKAMYEQFAGKENVRDTELNEIAQRIREQGESETSAAQRQLNQLKADLAAQGTDGKEREAKLRGKEERIAKEEGQSGGLALLEAGLAMMSGTSPNAFANIGQGAMVGTAAYRKSMDKIADAKDKLDDAYGRLEDVRFNQTSMNNSEIRKATADVDKAANAGLKSLTDFAVTRYGMKREDAKTMFTGAMQENVANIGARATMYSADRRSADNKDYINSIKGSGAIEQARKNVMEQVMKANKYGTPEELQTAFEAEWKKTLQLNPELAKLVGTSGGGSTVDTTGFKVLR